MIVLSNRDGSEMQKALSHKYTRKLENTLVEKYGCTKPHALTNAAKAMLNARDSHPGYAGDGLFKAVPLAVLNVMYGNPESLSERARLFDLPYLAKVGPQGASFPVSYLAERCIPAYYEKGARDFVKESGMSQADATLLSARLTEARRYARRDLLDRLCPDGKYLTPLTWSEASLYVCSKDSQAWPIGGSKKDPGVLQYLLDHPEERGESTLLGQRDQRNKCFPDGAPAPRCVFNSDVRDVVADAKFTVPLTRAMQSDARVDYTSPFMDLLGPDAVGSAQAKWYHHNGNKPMPYWAVMGDVTGMDQCVTKFHGEIFFEDIKDCFAPEYHAELRASIMHSFEDPLVLDEDHMLTAPHSIFSGVDWTHLIEEYISYLECLLFVGTVSFQLPCYRDGVVSHYRAVGPDTWKPALIQVCGDDTHVLIAMPDGANWVFDTAAQTPERHWTYCAAILRLEASVKKQAIWRNMSGFCSKLYSPKVEMGEGDESYFKPVYSPVLACNGILNPEKPLENPTLTNQLSKACQILDQVYGNEKYETLVTLLARSIDPDDAEKLRTLLKYNVEALDSRNAGRYGAYYAIGAPEWYAANSPTVALFLRILGMSAPEFAEWRTTLAHVHEMRRIHWMYRINPQDVVHPTSMDESAARYQMFFDDTLDPQDPNSAVNQLLQRRTIDAEGREVPLRSMTQYMPTLSWVQNWVSDAPLDQYKDAKAAAKALNRATQSNPKDPTIKRRF